MPEYMIKFKIPLEKQEFEDASHGSDWVLVVWMLHEWLFSKIKYGEGADVAIFEEVLDKLNGLIEEYGLSLLL